MPRRNFFSINLKSHQCFNKKKFKPINWTQIFNCGRKRPTKKTSSYCKIIEVTQSGKFSRRSSVITILPKLFFSKSLILSTGLQRRQSPPQITARWRYRLPMKNLTAHYNIQFCVSFHFCFC